MRDWEESFTVVQWDQRGAAKSYRREDREALKPTLTIDRSVLDAEELIEHLRKRYKRNRVVLMAHSFGTILGVKLAQRRPDVLYAYVGMGQFVDSMRSEALGYEQTLAYARAEKNQEAIAQQEAIAPFPDRAHPERNLQNLPTERRWLARYGGYFWAAVKAITMQWPGSVQRIPRRISGLDKKLTISLSQQCGMRLAVST